MTRAATLALALLMAAAPSRAGGAAVAATTPSREAGAARLVREAGWTMLGFPLFDTGRGVMLELSGRTGLGPVEILFEDGELRRIELDRDHTYRSGLYPLADFGGERRVVLVRFSARARSGSSRVRVLLAREAPTAG